MLINYITYRGFDLSADLWTFYTFESETQLTPLKISQSSHYGIMVMSSDCCCLYASACPAHSVVMNACQIYVEIALGSKSGSQQAVTNTVVGQK